MIESYLSSGVHERSICYSYEVGWEFLLCNCENPNVLTRFTVDERQAISDYVGSRPARYLHDLLVKDLELDPAKFVDQSGILGDSTFTDCAHTKICSGKRRMNVGTTKTVPQSIKEVLGRDTGLTDVIVVGATYERTYSKKENARVLSGNIFSMFSKAASQTVASDADEPESRGAFARQSEQEAEEDKSWRSAEHSYAYDDDTLYLNVWESIAPDGGGNPVPDHHLGKPKLIPTNSGPSSAGPSEQMFLACMGGNSQLKGGNVDISDEDWQIQVDALTEGVRTLLMRTPRVVGLAIPDHVRYGLSTIWWDRQRQAMEIMRNLGCLIVDIGPFIKSLSNFREGYFHTGSNGPKASVDGVQDFITVPLLWETLLITIKEFARFSIPNHQRRYAERAMQYYVSRDEYGESPMKMTKVDLKFTLDRPIMCTVPTVNFGTSAAIIHAAEAMNILTSGVMVSVDLRFMIVTSRRMIPIPADLIDGGSRIRDVHIARRHGTARVCPLPNGCYIVSAEICRVMMLVPRNPRSGESTVIDVEFTNKPLAIEICTVLGGRNDLRMC